MELNQVSYFINLAETLNFTAAARLSGVSQASLTRAIRSLEDELTYQPKLTDISNNESKDPALMSLNLMGRIPAIIDPTPLTAGPLPAGPAHLHCASPTLRNLSLVNAVVEPYAAGDIPILGNYSNIQAWLGRGLARPAVQRGLHIPARPA